MAEAEKLASVYVTSGELGEMLRLPEAEVRKLGRQNIFPRIPNPKKSDSFLYPVAGCVGAFIDSFKSELRRNQEGYGREKMRTEKARGDMLELEHALRLGKLHDAERCRQEQLETHSMVRRRLLILPHRAARRLPGDPIANESVLSQELGDCLSALAAGGKVAENGHAKTKKLTKTHGVRTSRSL